MSRFLKAFLRESLDGKLHLAAFGKHPAWDDHIDDFGLNTESLVLTKKLLYSQGIASQLASGAWDQIERSGNAIEFNHRFCWSRQNQAIAGAVWASTDRKRRTRFPMIVCAQIGVDGPKAIDLLLNPIDELGVRSRSVKTQDEFRELYNSVHGELCRRSVQPPAIQPSFELTESEQNSILPSLVAISAGIRAKHHRVANGSHFRLISTLSRTRDTLCLWVAYLAAQGLSSSPPFLAIATNGKNWVDLIIGEPVEKDFFCLRANETALPPTWLSIAETDRGKLESAARLFLEEGRGGQTGLRTQNRSWWTSLFGK
ncbi:MAG TPA: hypothetical protein VE860_17970 [Chthoniobacterales bacterium]|nr:hypothetical protein [Chthoniobacterales bacterium]